MHLVIDVRTATDHFPGIGRYIVSLASALAQVSPDLSISLLDDTSVSSTHLTLPELPRIACPVSPFSILQQWIVPKKLRKAGATLYHSPYYLMPYFSWVPTVLTCHDLIPLVYPQYFTSGQRLIFRLAHILALKAARKVIAVSHATKADLIRYFSVDPQRIAVIPEAADTCFQPQLPDRIAAVLRKYALPEKYVLYVGSNKPHKNLQRLIEAWKIVSFGIRGSGLGICQIPQSPVPNPQSPIKLVIAGHWDERYPEAKKLSEESGLKDKVLFIGPVEDFDLPALYSGAQLFVFPSLYEGFGLPVIEAMACGVPVLCSSVSSLPEVAGDAALLVDPQDVATLATAISQVLTDDGLRGQMREKGLRQSAQFSWKRTAQETLKVYTGVLTSER
ncbi:MAG: glycosyltransferase family 1 protein [Proteobacteria bacterium]|nr:glycosyltransferase family 1 protein [Pseudomonadota bacterium]